MIIDSHVHIFPNELRRSARLSEERTERYKKRGQSLLRPLTKIMHQAQPFVRRLPEPARAVVDQVGGLMSIPGLLFQSTPDDLIAEMDANGADYSFVLAQPPQCSNDFVYESTKDNGRLVFVANVPKGEKNPAAFLKRQVKRGAKVLKIHAANDGLDPNCEHYRKLIKAASEMVLPIIIHTGKIHNYLFYKNPNYGHAEGFEKWFVDYPGTTFILAHMNFHTPTVAVEIARKYKNVYVETSWQPSDVIGSAVHEIGAERVLYGSDWPFIGENFGVSIQRVTDCVERGLITEKDKNLVLGLNAARLIGIDGPPKQSKPIPEIPAKNNLSGKSKNRGKKSKKRTTRGKGSRATTTL